MTSERDGIVGACGTENRYKRQDPRGAGVDEEDVHRSIRRVRLGFGRSSGRGQIPAVTPGTKHRSSPGTERVGLSPLSAFPDPIPDRQGGKPMCGIVGYAGKERCVEVLMEGLGHLEYRGYDSAGLALQREGRIEQIREVGQLENLTRALASRNGDLSLVRTGVGHTRWATHGRPTEENAHPQIGGDGTVAVVHNGIIENFVELKEELQGRGVHFRSETDTEVMAHLIAERVEGGESLREALAAAL